MKPNEIQFYYTKYIETLRNILKRRGVFYMSVVNLISPKGEQVTVKVSSFYFFNRNKVKLMIEKGYTLLKEEDADLVIKLGIFE